MRHSTKEDYAKAIISTLSWKGARTVKALTKKYSLEELKELYHETMKAEKSCYYETLC